MMNKPRRAGRYRWLVAWGVVLITRSLAAGDETQSHRPWRTLPLVTNGAIDPHWKHLWGGGFSVIGDGSLRTDCDDAGMGLLLYTEERFGDCQIRVVFRTED